MVYTKRKLVNGLKKLREELGYMPSISDLERTEGYPSPYIFYKFFGSWNKALESAGLNVVENSGLSYTEEELIQVIRDKEMEIGRVPRRVDIRKDRKCPGVETYDRRFGSYENAVKKAGLEPHPRPVRYSDNQLKTFLKEFGEELGRIPTLEEINARENFPYYATFYKRLGPLKDFFEEIGIERTGGKGTAYKDEELVTLLKKRGEELGRVPHSEDMNMVSGYPSAQAYKSHFGSWNKALDKAGFETTIRPGKYSREELIEKIKELKEKKGHIPTIKEMIKERGFPSQTPYMREFGSWDKALEEARLDTEKGIPKKDLKDYLMKAVEELGHVPTSKELDGLEGYPCGRTYWKRFGSFNNALKEIGYCPSRGNYKEWELVEYVEKFAGEIGKIPEKREMSNAGPRYPRISSFLKKFGSWKDTIKKINPRRALGIVGPEELAKALAYVKKAEDYREFLQIGEDVTNIFGFEDRIVDRTLVKEIRSLFYQLEDDGLLKSDREFDIIGDDRKWETRFWLKKNDVILKYTSLYDQGNGVREKIATIDKDSKIYDKDYIWKRKSR